MSKAQSTPPYGQDLPPPGGFEHVRYRRNLPVRGPGGAVVFGGIFTICAFGFWRLGLGNLERRWAMHNHLSMY
jgi:NADH dehydrogenase (ubiquinone) 1 alpha subcomplex subunit 13